MYTNKILKGSIAVAIITFAFSSCTKDIAVSGIQYTILNPTKTDALAGNWKTVIADTAQMYGVVAPVSITSSDYKAQLDAIKTAQANITTNQQTAINYWGAGNTLRWNEIMRALVSKYNLVPAPNADNSYSFPDQTNPFAYPQFPFCNPPYAARSYAYSSVVVYDALVICAKMQQQFKRAAPYANDASVKKLLPSTTTPSYPSSEAVIATASVELLKFLFPTEVDFLNAKAIEAKDVAFVSGLATKSDIAAAETLGKAVAALVLVRAKTDGMKNAIGNANLWDSLANRNVVRTVNNVETAVKEPMWYSLDFPQRPPMLPFFGNVKAWSFAKAADVRVAAPPVASSDVIQTQLAESLNFSQNATRDQLALVHFWADGLGTYTPPGHWNAIAADLIQAAQLSEVRTARTYALLNMAMMDAAITCWDIKYYYYYPRPSVLDPRIKTLTGLPNFPGYTSGHSTFSNAAATILSYVFPNNAIDLKAQAEQASTSRIYGAIHLRIDCEVGLQSGAKIGNLLVARAKADGADQ